MKKENFTSVEIKGSTPEAVENKQRKAYIAPTLRHYGSLSELVQANPGRGGDGGMVIIDCTLS